MITVVRNPDQVLPYCVLAFKRGTLSADFKPPNIPKQASTIPPANNAPSPVVVAGTQQKQQQQDQQQQQKEQQGVHKNPAGSNCENRDQDQKHEDITDRMDQNRQRGNDRETKQ